MGVVPWLIAAASLGAAAASILGYWIYSRRAWQAEAELAEWRTGKRAVIWLEPQHIALQVKLPDSGDGLQRAADSAGR